MLYDYNCPRSPMLYKMTKQRTAILSFLRSQHAHAHPSAEEIYTAVKKAIPSMSLGTVYRNLSFLRDKGIIEEFSFGKDKKMRYEAFVETHAHFTCEKCGTVEDVRFARPDLFIAACGKTLDHEIHKLNISCKGICRNCMKASS
ncbi:MAG: transcriptional repressor [Parcubacteria group bacterium CG08_land_8_20_14_0_20_48_21]|nr:MAG: transcriptional repressor [Parcubacteria group bacterium CG08_land_8_20_14_0_20_48_21]PIW78898.1 MAG: transcriptional repressor [Parcubacteria group bacterium CG_4_8_14_3_um_filter_48_16]PIY77729.1 MAG: transcriptional repressor [Parcubacteria group bacterium CG_4_10_14_0_8_um_filter_48_154]PIZ77743.1 MAG: transcriptional repressor [bacterium CG_4_10_14_0_2_um_filter_48_144]PJC39761.1 MAG: transcriptional repressor [Parcubacteria group bacterium CG_4_9_14_0_2_um_filter_48_40]PJE52533.1